MNDTTIYSPVAGTVLALTDIADEVFRTEMLGKTVIIRPELADAVDIIAGNDGVISALFPTGHAFCITTDSGIEVLVHIGVDTVELKGKGFVQHKKQGDRVHAGEKVLTVNTKLLADLGYDISVPVVITNSYEFKSVDVLVNVGDEVRSGDGVLLMSS
ncbi:MAG: PTS glucose transporter subunit IIA [Bifidobacteriaceae bacterium]|jgi:PTS system beta-glucosides-specific IIC component|nr:PTS glucose transporter subunit IIA [Bifidobacteriaceae bacterium]